MGKYTAQVKGGLHVGYASSLGSIDLLNNAKDHRVAAQNLAHKRNFEFRAIVDELVMGGVGTTATMNYAEIEANVEMGGKRNIVNTPIINRQMTTADTADVHNALTTLSSDTYTPNPVPNGDRNPLGTR
jgi:hypothetical protein